LSREKEGMARIEELAKKLGGANSNLMATAEELTEQLDEVRKAYLTSMRAQARRVAELRTLLLQEIDAHQDLFNKPKSRVFDAVKLGLRKQKGSISWTVEDDILLARIRSQHPENSSLLISVKESPSKDGLARLSGDALKKLGVTITEDSDNPFVKFDEGDGYKLAESLVELAEKSGNGKGGK